MKIKLKDFQFNLSFLLLLAGGGGLAATIDTGYIDQRVLDVAAELQQLKENYPELVQQYTNQFEQSIPGKFLTDIATGECPDQLTDEGCFLWEGMFNSTK